MPMRGGDESSMLLIVLDLLVNIAHSSRIFRHFLFALVTNLGQLGYLLVTTQLFVLKIRL
jgi:hypothetical protein